MKLIYLRASHLTFSHLTLFFSPFLFKVTDTKMTFLTIVTIVHLPRSLFLQYCLQNTCLLWLQCTFLCKTLIFLSLISMWSRSSVSSELSLFLSWVVWRACWVFFSIVLFFSSRRCRISSTWRSIPEECCKPKHTGVVHISWFFKEVGGKSRCFPVMEAVDVCIGKRSTIYASIASSPSKCLILTFLPFLWWAREGVEMVDAYRWIYAIQTSKLRYTCGGLGEERESKEVNVMWGQPIFKVGKLSKDM